MTASVTTLLAIRQGFGVRPGEDGQDGAAALLPQSAEDPQWRLAFPREGAAGRCETAEKVMTLRIATIAASRGSLMR